LGAMGTALAGAFLDNGHPTTVWNRSPAKAEALAPRGAVVAPTAAEAVAASPLVVVCVLDYDAVHGVLDPVTHALTGRVLVNLTSGTPRQAREAADWAAANGADYIDGGILAVPSMIGRPETLILYSGSERGFRSHEGTLGVLGMAMHLGADAGRAALYDAALVSAMYGMFGGFLHAAAVLGSERIPAVEFTPLIVSWLNAMAATLPETARAYDSSEQSAAESNLRMQAAGFVKLLEASREQGVSTELLEPMKTLLDRAVAAGFGDRDIQSLIDLLHTHSVAAR
jgi:3-hydroxyisobutyrate dehydrogenase-like beta-hydroxyacid dehydrogenase